MVMSEVRGPLSATEESPIAVGRVLEEKLHPPAARAEWIERPRLLRQIAKGLDHPVLLVAAPAGYGKSTLVTQWVGSRDADPTVDAHHRGAGAGRLPA
jgi:hypothetical protein